MADSIEIRDVWKDNLDQEFEEIRRIIDDCHVVAMDTEFPGAVFERPYVLKDEKDDTYWQLKQNVDETKLIQLGLTFSDKYGNLPTYVNTEVRSVKKCIWQFNFKEFNEKEDKFVESSIKLLKVSGINFEKNKKMGIDVKRFGELLMSSGVVLNAEICWVSFQGGSDFGYLLKLLRQKKLPKSREKFFRLIKIFFPTVYDVKYMSPYPSYGLKKLAQNLKVTRIGIAHQAGSDSLLTFHCFKKIIEMYFPDGSTESYAGVLFGLNEP